MGWTYYCYSKRSLLTQPEGSLLMGGHSGVGRRIVVALVVLMHVSDYIVHS